MDACRLRTTNKMQSSMIVLMDVDNRDLEDLKEEIRKAREIAEGAKSSCMILRGELDETNRRVDELEKNEMSISNSLVYIMRYLRLNAEVSTSIKTTLKILIAIVSLFSGISSIMRFVQSFLL